MPNPKVAKLNLRLGEISSNKEEKIKFVERACWGFGLCFGEGHGCTHKAIASLDAIQTKAAKSCKNDEEEEIEAKSTENLKESSI